MEFIHCEKCKRNICYCDIEKGRCPHCQSQIEILNKLEGDK